MSIKRKGRQYTTEEVLSKVKFTYTREKSDMVDFDGDKIFVNNAKLQLFAEKGIKCCQCGIEGKYFVKEKHVSQRQDQYFSLNLYAVNDNNQEVLMTKDHSIAKYNGGLDDITNFNVMCANCNSKKGIK